MRTLARDAAPAMDEEILERRTEGDVIGKETVVRLLEKGQPRTRIRLRREHREVHRLPDVSARLRRPSCGAG